MVGEIVFLLLIFTFSFLDTKAAEQGEKRGGGGWERERGGLAGFHKGKEVMKEDALSLFPLPSIPSSFVPFHRFGLFFFSPQDPTNPHIN